MYRSDKTLVQRGEIRRHSTVTRERVAKLQVFKGQPEEGVAGMEGEV